MTKGPRKQMPDNFAALCGGRYSSVQLSAMLEVSYKLVMRWANQVGPDAVDGLRIAGKRRQREQAHANSRANARAVARGQMCRGLPMPQNAQVAASSDPLMAMRYLQRFWPCYPLAVVAKALPGYRFGRRVMQADELIAEAKRRGWQPDAWRNIAA